MKPTLKAIHIAKSLEKANRTSQNLSISMSLPTLTKRKYDRTTKCINHWADNANFKGVTFNKICSGSTGKCFEMPNASYTNRSYEIALLLRTNGRRYPFCSACRKRLRRTMAIQNIKISISLSPYTLHSRRPL